MDQRTRNKMAWVLTVALVPVLIYVVIASSRKVADGRRRPPSSKKGAAPAPHTMGPAGKSAGGKRTPKNKRKAIDPAVLAEQKKLAVSSPRHDPFSVSKRLDRIPPAATNTVDIGREIRVTGIVSRMAPDERMAVINGKVLAQGERTEGWTIVKINSDSVVLDNGKKKVTVHVK